MIWDQVRHSEADLLELSKYRIPDMVWDGSGELAAASTFINAFTIGTALGRGEADVLLNHFVDGNGSYKDFDELSDMAVLIGSVTEFRRFANAFETRFRNHLTAGGTLESFRGDDVLPELRPGNLGSDDNLVDLFSWTVLGGWYKLQATITVHSPDHFMVKYFIGDHFGAGIADSWSWLPGLPAMYYLQHYLGSANKYRPFYWRVSILRQSWKQ